jgi:hypothetical protein
MTSADDVRDARRRLGRQLAAQRRAAGYTQHTLAPLTLYGRSTIANVEIGAQRVPRQFWIRCDDVLGAEGRLLAAFDAVDALERRLSSDELWLTPAPGPIGGQANVALIGSSPGSGLDLLLPPQRSPAHAAVADLAESLMLSADADPPKFDSDDLQLIVAAVTAAREAYQHSRYRDALRLLPGLVARTGSAIQSRVGGTHSLLLRLSAAIYQTASGVLLKFDAPALAAIAADRSMAAATACGAPAVMAASSRAMVHSLTANGHPEQAVSTAITAVERLDRDGERDHPDGLSVRGALLLRAALAAAQREDRSTAIALLDEANVTANRLGRDANVASTAFGPTNVVLHRVSAAVHLGDAGTAVHLAAAIDLGRLPVAERKAMFYIDVATAFTQWGRHERAFNAVRAAEQVAPEEVRARAAVHRMLRDLLLGSPPHLQPRVRRFAEAVGALE